MVDIYEIPPSHSLGAASQFDSDCPCHPERSRTFVPLHKSANRQVKRDLGQSPLRMTRKISTAYCDINLLKYLFAIYILSFSKK